MMMVPEIRQGSPQAVKAMKLRPLYQDMDEMSAFNVSSGKTTFHQCPFILSVFTLHLSSPSSLFAIKKGAFRKISGTLLFPSPPALSGTK